MNAVHYFWLYLKGMAMGCADVVPGVSGGTIAFITGIYTELLDSIKSVDLKALQVLFRKGPKAAWQHINGTFLVVLLAGILTAILTLAKLIHYLLDNHATLVWSFFFGLILASAWHMAKQLKSWSPDRWLSLAAGVVVAAWISMAGPAEIEASYMNIFMAGSIAICAMILPGISGSFILLLMGIYAPVLAAVKGLQIDIILLFGAGAALGLLLFSRLLSWLLHHYQELMFALLTGFMLGALTKVWPWKETISWRLNSKGEQVPFLQSNILPDGSDVQGLIMALGLAIIGFVCVLLLEKLSPEQE